MKLDLKFNEFKQELPEIFEKVRKDVKTVYGRRRAGLSLGLIEMGMTNRGFIGGMHLAPGTNIVMNKTPLRLIMEEQPYKIVWAYAYHILLHEYVHSLGVLNEQQCRAITLRITEEIFSDENHPAVILAKKGIRAYFPNLPMVYAPPKMRPDGISIEYIEGFDKPSYSYYS